MRVIPFGERKYIAASHENPENPGVFKKVVAVKDELLAGRVQMLNWALLPRGHSFNSHYHEDMQEIFMIMGDGAEMTVNGNTAVLNKGDTMIVDPGEVHRMRNCSDRDIEYVVFGISLGLGGKTVVVDESA